MKKALVTGAGGFIGSHLVKYLIRMGYWVRGVDLKYPEFEPSAADEFELLDLRTFTAARRAVEGIDEVYHLAADMGGIGYIETHKARIVTNNTLIDLNMLQASEIVEVDRFFFASSACVYPGYLQNKPHLDASLKEKHAYPADPEDGYGWEKLYAERLCRHYREDYGLETRVARFHNIYGPLGTYEGGREKSPAAICRKIALANNGDEIEVWGDGQQTRSYCYVDDCVQGIYRLMQSDYAEPLNIGSDRMVTINELVDIVARIAGKTIHKRYDLTRPQGVRGRNSDNTRCRLELDWEPAVSLEAGLAATYTWIRDQVREKHNEVS